MTVTEIQSLAEFKTLIDGDEYVAVDFWAEWCGPCKMISPVFEGLSSSQTVVKCYKVNVDDQPEISQEVGIRAMPTFILFRKGAKIDELVGANPQALNTLFQKAV